VTAPRPGSVLVTGAGSGLGRHLALQLAEAGYDVVALGRKAPALATLADAAAEARASGTIQPFVGDARDADALADAVAEAGALPGGLYAVIANAGIAGPTKPLAELSDAEWDETIDTNLAAVFRLCRAALPALTARAAGRIVLIGSATGKRPLPGRTPYATSKLALVGLARTLAVEVGRAGTTVNVVSPFLLEGDRLESVIELQAGLRGLAPEEVRAELFGETALGRPVTPGEVASLVAYLLAEEAGSLTGQDFNVSAGSVMY